MYIGAGCKQVSEVLKLEGVPSWVGTSRGHETGGVIREWPLLFGFFCLFRMGIGVFPCRLLPKSVGGYPQKDLSFGKRVAFWLL